MLYLSASDAMIRGEALYQVYAPLPLPYQHDCSDSLVCVNKDTTQLVEYEGPPSRSSDVEGQGHGIWGRKSSVESRGEAFCGLQGEQSSWKRACGVRAPLQKLNGFCCDCLILSSRWAYISNKKLSWCWQTRVTRLETSQGPQTWPFHMLGIVFY